MWMPQNSIRHLLQLSLNSLYSTHPLQSNSAQVQVQSCDIFDANMMRTMSYQPTSLTFLGTHAFRETTGPVDSLDENAGSAEPPCFKNHFQPVDHERSTWSFKEEPMDAENQPLVMPTTGLHSPRSHHRRDACDGQGSVGNHPYPAPDAQTGGQTNGNIPSHLQSTNNSSDSDTSSQDGGKKTLDDSAEMVTGTFRFSVPKNGLINIAQTRAKREFVPDSKKDESYWNKRRKNNVSAKLSRMKRKTLEKMMEQKLITLEEENFNLKCELEALKKMFGDKLTRDLTTATPGSPTSSSGLGTSASSLSGIGSAENSSSSSPSLNTDEDKKTSPPAEENLNIREKGMKESGEHQSNFYHLPVVGSRPSPPPAHSKTQYVFSSLSSHRIHEYAPPVAHSPYYGASSFCPPNFQAQAVNFSANEVPRDWQSEATGAPFAPHTASSASANFCQQLSQETCPLNYKSASSSENSPGPSSSSGGLTGSEDDSSSNSDLRKASSGDQDKDTLQKMRGIPLKFRMKLKHSYSFQHRTDQ